MIIIKFRSDSNKNDLSTVFLAFNLSKRSGGDSKKTGKADYENSNKINYNER